MGFKDNLLKLARALAFKPDEFDAFGIYEWPAIMKRVEKEFIIKINSNTQFNQWRENLKSPQLGLALENPIAPLSLLIDRNEKVWFVACDSYRDPTKLWLFQGYIEPIQRLLESHYRFEFYVISKKYEWLLCADHLNNLIGLGTIIPKIQQQGIRNFQY
ncbi:DUF6756 family protein [Sabulibacter ruber]|uniref:DUF6756 family protein n=1 Tax=Sabulibacter ruber TaxID=2811901 RepID=UPI001A97327F|nr:DUF6756 family protein [Sabulibacter ruber]